MFEWYNSFNGEKKRHIRDELILISAKGYMELYCPRYAEVPKINPWDIMYTLEINYWYLSK